MLFSLSLWIFGGSVSFTSFQERNWHSNSHFSLKHPWANLSSNKLDLSLGTPSISSKLLNSKSKLCIQATTLTRALMFKSFSIVSFLTHTIVLSRVCAAFTAGHDVTTVLSLFAQWRTLGQILLNITSSWKIWKRKWQWISDFALFSDVKEIHFWPHNSSIPTCLTELQAVLEKWACVFRYWRLLHN